MNCKFCNFILEEGDMFCKNCGNRVNDNVAKINNESHNENNNHVHSAGVHHENHAHNMNNMHHENRESNMNSYHDQVRQVEPMNNKFNQGQNIPMNQYNNQARPQMNTPQRNNMPAKKTDPSKYILIGVIAVLAFALVFVLTSNKISLNNNEENNNNNNNVIQTGNTKTSYKVKYNNFEFSVPDNLIYDTSSGKFVIGNEEGTWAASVSTVASNYNQLKANKGQIKINFESKGIKASTGQIKKVKGVEFLNFELSDGYEKILASYTSLNSMKVAALTIMFVDGEADYSVLEELAPVISSAVYYDASSHMEVKSNFDIIGVLDSIK